MLRPAAERQISFTACRSKLAEVVEKTMKAELIRLGWTLERTHDLERLLDDLVARNSDLVAAFEHALRCAGRRLFHGSLSRFRSGRSRLARAHSTA
jgi:HEPN domain-containing protein